MISLVLKVCQRLIACYPKIFRIEFSDEMQTVFAASMAEAQHSGNNQFWKLVCTRWSCVIWQVHLEARKGNPIMEDDLWVFASELCILKVFGLDGVQFYKAIAFKWSEDLQMARIGE